MDAKARGKNKDRKKVLCSELAGAVRKLQAEYVQSLQIQSGSAAAEHVCDVIEAIFLHELKNPKSGGGGVAYPGKSYEGVLWREVKQRNSLEVFDASFWMFIDPLVSDEIKMQLHALRNSDSDVKKCRSWVRLVLAKGIALSFLQDLQRHPGLLAFHYGGDAVLRDVEQSEVILQLLKGLSVMQLQYDFASSRLDTWDTAVLQLAGVWSAPKSTPTHKATPTHAATKGNERVSPPASDFDFDGVQIIDLAMDKYTQRKASNTFTDSQLISHEVFEQQKEGSSPDTQAHRVGSFGSVGSSTGIEPEDSYRTMLKNYARRTSADVVGVGSRVGGGGSGRSKPGGGGGESSRYLSTPFEQNDESFAFALSLNYEVLTTDGSVLTPQQNDTQEEMKLLMLDHMTKLVNEKGLDSQSYHCAGCKRPIGIIFGQAKLCKFNGQHYCFDCHNDDERVIPSRVLFNWDFRKHKVSISSAEFLDTVESTPLLNIHEVNKTLYMYIPLLEEALMFSIDLGVYDLHSKNVQKLRKQCKHLKEYLLSCNDQEIKEQFTKRLSSSHLIEDVHLYSLHELMQVNGGTFNEKLKKIVKIGRKHVKQCLLCSQKGFLCETCHSDQVIYPFDLDETYQCSSCKCLYHRSCKPRKSSGCGKCLRLEKRRAASFSENDFAAANQHY